MSKTNPRNVAIAVITSVSVLTGCATSEPAKSTNIDASEENIASTHSQAIDLTATAPTQSEDFAADVLTRRDRYSEYIERSARQREVIAAKVVANQRVLNGLNVRATPEVQDGNIVDRLQPGQTVDLVQEVSDEWLEVRMEDGETGYVAQEFSMLLGERDLELHFIDVGQGDSTLVLCPNGNNILVDAGTTTDPDWDIVRDYVFERINPDDPIIHSLVVTHADWDHYRMLPFVLDGVNVGPVFHVGARNHYSDKNVFGDVSFRKWMDNVASEEKTKYSRTYFDAPDSPNPDIDCGDAEIYVLAADVRADKSWKNARSIVLMIEYGDFKAILTGDATKDTENVVLSRYSSEWLDASVLKIGHHGSLATSTSSNWANATQPEVAVVSAGWRSEYGHPRNEVLERLEPHTIEWDPHFMSSATPNDDTPQHRDYIWHDDPNYVEAIFSTAANGTVVVIADGSSEFEVTWFDYE